MATFTIRSKAFAPNAPIPKKYTGEGEDVSPPLHWEGAPEGTRQLALICDDPDAPTEHPWVHWVLYAVPAKTEALSEGVPPKEKLESPPGAMQGKNSWPSGRIIGYRGPLPPPGHGVHHYHFKLYALSETLDPKPGWTKEALLKAIHGKVLAECELVGTYSR